MKIFVAGASGAIGRPLIAGLIAKGHSVVGIGRTEASVAKLRALGAEGVVLDVFDAAGVEAAVKASGAEVLIDELTSLPQDPSKMAEAAEGDRRVRLEGGGNLYRAALACGVRRYIQQASGFFVEPGEGLADETAGLAVGATPNVAKSAQTYAKLEARVLAPSAMEGVALRYGFFYGPGTWYDKGAAAAGSETPLIGDGQGMWNWIHIDDAAAATVAALDCAPGIYHVVDDEPMAMSVWLPAFAKFVGAPPPVRISEEQALQVAGADAVYYQTRLRGVSSAKAKKAWGFAPRKLEWL